MLSWCTYFLEQYFLCQFPLNFFDYNNILISMKKAATVFNRTLLNILKNLFRVKLLYTMIRICHGSIKELSPSFKKVHYYLKHFERTETTLKWLLVLTILMTVWLYWSTLQSKIITLKLQKSCRILRVALKHTGLYSKSFWIIKKCLSFHYCITKMNL